MDTHDPRIVRITRILGWAGVVPFAALAGATHIGVPEPVDRLLVGYALAILAFMSGHLWSASLQRPTADPAPLVASNVLVLIALPVLLIPPAWAALWLAVLFALQAAAEWRWVRAAQPGWYRRLRLMLASSVVILLVLAGLAVTGRG